LKPGQFCSLLKTTLMAQPS